MAPFRKSCVSSTVGGVLIAINSPVVLQDRKAAKSQVAVRECAVLIGKSWMHQTGKIVTESTEIVKLDGYTAFQRSSVPVSQQSGAHYALAACSGHGP